MLCVPSTLFRLIKFPHEGKIVTVDQLSFFASTSENNVQIPNPPDSVGPGLFKDPILMGIFPAPPLHTAQVNMISRSDDPWLIPTLEQVLEFGESMPLTPVEISYCEIVAAYDPPPP